MAEIINARVEEIFEKVDQEFRRIERSGLLPAGVIFVGGGADLDGLVEAAKKKLRLPAALGVAKNINVIIDKVRSPEFLTALGLVIWGGHADSESGSDSGFKKSLGGILAKTKGLWSKIMPK